MYLSQVIKRFINISSMKVREYMKKKYWKTWNEYQKLYKYYRYHTDSEYQNNIKQYNLQRYYEKKNVQKNEENGKK